jgi:hypothetical protein
VTSVPAGGEPLPDDVRWDPWRPHEVAGILAHVRAPWAVAGGWALDLFAGRTTRAHDDLEIAVPAAGFDEVRDALAGYDADVVGSGRRWPLHDPAFAELHQTWFRDPATGTYRLDVFREPHDGPVWICRRDPRIRRPYRDVVLRSPDGVPFVAPEVVLLFKAKHDRAKDRDDLRRVLPLLGARRQAWLAEALRLVHPGHAWSGVLAATP